jgi:hypothetical protein
MLKGIVTADKEYLSKSTVLSFEFYLVFHVVLSHVFWKLCEK